MDFRNAHLFIDLQFATGSFLPFHNIHGVLKAKILKWFAIPFSSGPHSVRPLHHDPPVLGGVAKSRTKRLN